MALDRVDGGISALVLEVICCSCVLIVKGVSVREIRDAKTSLSR
jgi:hypothetical protein